MRAVLILEQGDVGSSVVKRHGNTYWLNDCLGRVQGRDVGKRIYAVRDNANTRDVYQLESDEQYEQRKRTGRLIREAYLKGEQS